MKEYVARVRVPASPNVSSVRFTEVLIEAIYAKSQRKAEGVAIEMAKRMHPYANSNIEPAVIHISRVKKGQLVSPLREPLPKLQAICGKRRSAALAGIPHKQTTSKAPATTQPPAMRVDPFSAEILNAFQAKES